MYIIPTLHLASFACRALRLGLGRREPRAEPSMAGLSGGRSPNKAPGLPSSDRRKALKFIVEGSLPTSSRVADQIRRSFPATFRDAEEGYGRIIVLQDGVPPMTLCSFLLDMEEEDVLTLFWVKLKEMFPKLHVP